MLLSEAINVTKKSGSGDADVYIGEMDPEWCIGVVPNGGYALSQIVESCVQKQYSSPHPDPIQVTAHFLNSPSASAFEVHIRLLKTGKTFTNLEAVLLQDSVTKISSHLIFGVLEPLPSQGSNSEKKSKGYDISFLPPSPYARRLPLYHHPRTAPRTSFPSRLNFHSRLELTHEPEIAARNEASSPHRTSTEILGGGAVESGFWCGFSNQSVKNGSEAKTDEVLSVSTLSFFADISPSAVLLLPTEYRKGLGISWFPTISMTIEYKFAIPRPSKATPSYSNRTVGVFSSTSFLHGALGRHTSSTEVWTAPCDIGEAVEVAEGWRDDQVCLAVSTQMAVIVPIEKNLGRGKGKL
ncbi:thioesterase-like superfamily-domain-containing protein [Lentinula detonsa]|uniref:Thioesterase-like superfamily-domain-containing protein n=1 Tax=Lentinula detonsa TaxID=2804962 RepID=A0A9W8NVL3_9AGAR|nr:thioesterase-like superfamily-domain-containing protein [Lentinula detonsa]